MGSVVSTSFSFPFVILYFQLCVSLSSSFLFLPYPLSSGSEPISYFDILPTGGRYDLPFPNPALEVHFFFSLEKYFEQPCILVNQWMDLVKIASKYLFVGIGSPCSLILPEEKNRKIQVKQPGKCFLYSFCLLKHSDNLRSKGKNKIPVNGNLHSRTWNNKVIT